jgi:putative transposase
MFSVMMRTIIRTQRFELRPTRAQAAALARQAGARRFVWNWALERRVSHYRKHGRTLSARELSAELTKHKARPETAWLKEADSQLLQQALRDLNRAFESFFARRAGYPRFKSRKREAERFRIPQRVRLRGERVYCPKVGWIRTRVSREVTGELKSATFKREPCGRWYVTLVEHYRQPTPPAVPITVAGLVGIDVGVREMIVTTVGERVPAPRYYHQQERRLRREQRSLSRKQRGSRNRVKARVKVARTQRRTANLRKDFLHKLTTRLVAEQESFAIETLSVKGLARTKLAKSVLDASFGEFNRQLQYKAERAGKSVIRVDRFFPSSKQCSECEHVNHGLTLAEREWTCPVCGQAHDRDENAALNIKREAMRLVVAGQAETLNACGVRVRRPKAAADATRQPAEEARIPRL